MALGFSGNTPTPQAPILEIPPASAPPPIDRANPQPVPDPSQTIPGQLQGALQALQAVQPQGQPNQGPPPPIAPAGGRGTGQSPQLQQLLAQLLMPQQPPQNPGQNPQNSLGALLAGLG